MRYCSLISEMFLPQFPKVEKASPEQVDAAPKQNMAALASLYLEHNTDETVSLVITWKYSVSLGFYVIRHMIFIETGCSNSLFLLLLCQTCLNSGHDLTSGYYQALDCVSNFHHMKSTHCAPI